MRAQISHAFIWIFTLIILGLIFLFSFNLINKTIQTGNSAEIARFTNTYYDSLERYDGFGTYKIQEFLVPSGYNRFCAIKPGAGTKNDDLYAVVDDFVISQYLQNSQSDQDAFLIGDEETLPLGFFNQTKNDAFCVNATNNRFRIGFEGKGREVLLINPDKVVDASEASSE